ncbi:MAG: hypothetical protein JSS04_01600 [Proteobacteria bacterium]|nr:hypothetical protein [Pseudomonadota bacterium]
MMATWGTTPPVLTGAPGVVTVVHAGGKNSSGGAAQAVLLLGTPLAVEESVTVIGAKDAFELQPEKVDKTVVVDEKAGGEAGVESEVAVVQQPVQSALGPDTKTGWCLSMSGKWPGRCNDGDRNDDVTLHAVLPLILRFVSRPLHHQT